MSAKQHSTLLGKVLVALKYISLIVITLVCLAPHYIGRCYIAQIKDGSV